MQTNELNRRDFITKSSIGLVGASAGLVSREGKVEKEESETPKIKEFRTLGRTGFKVSDIGCGPAAMTNENLLKAVLETGVNIIETAEFYGNGNNELLVGRAIKDLDRKSLFINTKLIIKNEDTKETIITRVRKCLERLNTSYLDGLMLWNPEKVEDLKNPAFHEAFQFLKAEGRAKSCGVSCHGSEYPSNAKDNMEKIIIEAIEDGRYDVALFVYNYVQRDMGENILKAAARKNVGTILMKTDPFGKRYFDLIAQVKTLNSENKPVPEKLKIRYDAVLEKQKIGEEFLKSHQLTDISKTSASVRFVLDNPAVSSVIITFGSFDDIKEYISLSGTKLTPGDISEIETLKKYYSHLYCRHACGICQINCPYDVPVNTIMRYNRYFTSNRQKEAIQKYYKLNGSKAEKCLRCPGYCEAACPYGVSIHALMTVAYNNLELTISC